MLSDRRSRTDREDLARWEEEGGTIARFSAEPKVRQPHALVVEDDDDYREAIVETLEEAGYRALGVASGEQALDAIHDEPFLVLVDLRMPRMDGSELLTAMQAELGSRMPPVVFLTGAFPSAIENIGAPVLSKPVDVDRLLSVVGHHCPRALAVGT
jgi:CheY-like chemotaxis protein